MPILNEHVTLNTSTATLIAGRDNMPQDVIVHDAEHSQSTTVFLGNESVTAANGLHLHSDETIQMTLGPGDQLWAIASSGTPTVHVIRIQKLD
jgi:hypothetical protein